MIFKRALLTGAAGKLGSVLRKELSSKFELLRSTDIVPVEGAYPNEEFVIADLGDPAVASKLVEGVDAIIHFGAIVRNDAEFADINRVNMVGTHSLYDAALNQGIRRVVYASSVHAVGFYEQTEVIDARAPTRPDNYYGLSKVFGEAVAQLYWDRHGIETVSVRIGSSEETASNHRHLKTWLSFADMVQLVERALSVPRVGHTIIFGTSANAASFWDNRLAAHIGYVPRDSADRFLGEIVSSDPNPDLNDPVMKYQGGSWAA